MTKPRTGQSGNWDRERADRLQKDVERMQKDIERLTTEREWSEDRFPCDGGCVDAPEETCSRHGRSPADLWRIIGQVTAERDALAAQVARVESLAEDWRYKGQFGWGPWQIGEGPDPEGYVMDHCASALRDALAGSEADHDMPTENWTCPRCNRELPAQVWVCDCVPSPQSTEQEVK